MNHTELWQCAARIGIKGACPATPREELIQALTNLEHTSFQDPTASMREYYSQFLTDHWGRFQMQVPRQHCPNCHLGPPTNGQPLLDRIKGETLETFCTDMEFMDCWMDNKHRVS